MFVDTHRADRLESNAISPAVRRLQRHAQRYLDAGQLTAAQATLESLLKYLPDDAALRMTLGGIQLQRGQPRLASKTLLQALGSAPGQAELMADLARNLLMSGESRAARDALARAIITPKTPAAAIAILAHAHYLMGLVEPALTLMEEALSRGTDEPKDHYLHASLLEFTGKLQAAKTRFDACLERWPDFSTVALARAHAGRWTESVNHVGPLRAQFMQASATSTARAEWGFALFKELDDMGRRDEAWPFLEQANSIMHQRNRYDPRLYAAMVDAIVQYAPPRDPDGQRCDGPMPIFIVGMPRSGSTLLDRMLSNHPRITSAGELGDFPAQLRWLANLAPDADPARAPATIKRERAVDPAELGQRYLEQTQWRAGDHAFYIDKLPDNFHRIDLIRLALPRAPIIYMQRPAMAVCFSNYKAMFGERHSAYSYDMHCMASCYAEHARLLGHWRRSRAVAMHEVAYADLVHQPAATLRTVLAYCGLALDDACLHPTANPAPVMTPSSAQVRQPVHTRGLDDWKHYREQLQPMERALAACAMTRTR